jgi:hypothetical protein
MIGDNKSTHPVFLDLLLSLTALGLAMFPKWQDLAIFNTISFQLTSLSKALTIIKIHRMAGWQILARISKSQFYNFIAF